MKLLFFFLLLSCSIQDLKRSDKIVKKNSVNFFNYSDQSGSYRLKREIKTQGAKLVSRVKLFSLDSTTELESVVSVSKIGKSSTQNSVLILPEVSQFRVWYDKKEHFSQLKISPKKRKLEVLAKSPTKNFEKSYDLPRAKYICFFTQLAECLKRQNLLYKAAKKKLQVYIIWESYPYHLDQLQGVSDMPFVGAMLSLDEHRKNNYRFSLDLGNQILFLQYNKNLLFKGYHWVSQGISAEAVDKE